MTRGRTETQHHWPTPRPHETEVLLLGTYHMDNPGLDVVNVDADDVLAPARQRELRDLADRLISWDPDLVAIERPHDRQDQVDSLYEDYRTGVRTYDAEATVDPPHPARNDPTTECRSETVQVGFRLADRLDHERVHAVDCPMRLDARTDDEAEAVDLGELTRRATSELDVPLPDPGAKQRETDEHLHESTIPEHLHWLNQEDRLHGNHDLMFAAAMAGTDRRYLGSELLGAWYERNLRMVENVWRATDDTDERVLLLVGSGHVHVLRHLFDEMPMCCPVSPLPLLG
ncbi:DUF5694 domain-containing protein [Haloarchaeobius sp. DYHT-AS-18]|uniref:DUF5694 domain-containing protein n=1 Tax=Haloarchaeobius sp. DYHT-AS-18 TaxID=3446117 RepID=UPI003EB7FFF0